LLIIAVFVPLLIIEVAIIFISYVIPIGIAFLPIILIKRAQQAGKQLVSDRAFILFKIICPVLALLLSVLVFTQSAPLYNATAGTWCTIAGGLDGTGKKYENCTKSIPVKNEISSKFILELKINTPKKINSELVLNKIYPENKDAVFVYTLTNHKSGNSVNQSVIQKFYLSDLSQVCSSVNYRKFLNKGSAIRYLYKDNDTKILSGRMIEIKQCRELDAKQ
jgi:hypothetical protein